MKNTNRYRKIVCEGTVLDTSVISFEEYFEQFLVAEEKNKLFGVEIDGFYPWHYLRFTLCEGIYNYITGTNSYGKTILPENYQGKMSLSDYYRKYLCRNIWKFFEKKVLIVPHQRRVYEGGYYRDIFTSHIDDSMNSSHYILDYDSSTEVYIRQKAKNIIPFEPEIYRDDSITFDNKRRMSTRELDCFLEPLLKYFDISPSVDVKNGWLFQINSRLNERARMMPYFAYIVKRIKPKAIVMLESYSGYNMPLCEVAHKFKIPVIEVQHGYAANLHIAYNFLKKRKLASFPDYFLSFGQYEKDITRFPIDKERVVPVGFPEMESFYKSERLKDNGIKKKKQILFIDGLPLKICEYAKKISEILPQEDYKTVVKLHPMECEREDYYKEFFRDAQVELISEYTKPIHHYIMQSEWVVGVDSTVLYEAVFFKKKVAVIRASRYEKTKQLIEHNNAILVNSVEELVGEIVDDSFSPKNTDYYYEKNSLKKMISVIEDVARGKIPILLQ